MGQRLLFFFLLISLTFVSSSSAQTKKSDARKPAEIEILASWRMKAPNDHVFSLHEDKHELRTVKALTFSIGEKEQRTFPVDKDKWEKWRTRLVSLMTKLSVGKKCPHPLRFETQRKDESVKSKNVCLDEITESERSEIQKLVTEWNEYLYGKE